MIRKTDNERFHDFTTIKFEESGYYVFWAGCGSIFS
jgi:hypothetical protein